MVRAVLAMAVWSLGMGFLACGNGDPSEDCATYCEVKARCCAGSPDLCRDTTDIPTCTSGCRKLSDDDADYATAVADKVDCFEEEDEACEQVLGGCLPDGD